MIIYIYIYIFTPKDAQLKLETINQLIDYSQLNN